MGDGKGEQVNMKGMKKEMDILAIDERWIKKIRYGQMQGRPIVKLEIQRVEIECLLDTGARINLMSYNKFQQLVILNY